MRELPGAALFQRILEKYHLNKTVSTDIRRRIRKVKKREYRKTIKRAGASSLLLFLVSLVFFPLKQCGLNVTMAQSAIIAAALFAVSASVMAAGAYTFLVGSLMKPGHVESQEHRKVEKPGAVVEEPLSDPSKGSRVLTEKRSHGEEEKIKSQETPDRDKDGKMNNDFWDAPVDHVPGL